MPNKKLSKYEKHERKLGTLFLHSFPNEIKQAKFTEPNSYSTYDGWYATRLQPDASVCFEIKVRDFEYTKYPDYILESGKLKNLLKLHTQGHRVLYMNFFKNDKGYYDLIIFDLSKRVPDWKEFGCPTVIKKMNAATFKSKYDKVDKEVIMLKYDDRYDVKITDTQWK